MLNKLRVYLTSLLDSHAVLVQWGNYYPLLTGPEISTGFILTNGFLFQSEKLILDDV